MKLIEIKERFFLRKLTNADRLYKEEIKGWFKETVKEIILHEEEKRIKQKERYKKQMKIIKETLKKYKKGYSCWRLLNRKHGGIK